ncbi:MAG: DUF5711 family protein [Lachnospiraceae bacterium]|nr:DUF5711 family protein [Lachnospiraceae bacterium]
MKEFSIYVNSAEKMEKAQRRKKFYRIYRSVLGIAIVILLFFCFIAYQYREFHSFHREKTIIEEGMSSESMESYKNGIIKYSENQIAYYNSAGTKEWSKTYSISNPHIKICGDYIMVADLKGTQILVFNQKGEKHKISTAYSITDAEIAEQGVIAVALAAKNTNYIELYNLSQEKLVSIQTSIDENGYPLDISLSPNGEILCASYFIVDGVETKNRLTFYDFSEDGKRTENILGGFDYDNTIVPTVAFIKKDTVLAFGDDKISVYHIGSKPKLIKEIAIQSSIKSIAYDKDHFAIVRERYTDESEGNYTLEVFSKNGNKVGNCSIDDDYTSMNLYGNKIILNSAYHSMIVNTNGKKIFDYNFSKHLIRMIPGKKSNIFFTAYEDRLDMIKLK